MSKFIDCQSYWFNYFGKFQEKYKEKLKNVKTFSLSEQQEGLIQKEIFLFKNLRFEKKKLKRQFKDANVISLDTVIDNHQVIINQEDVEITNYSLLNKENGEELFVYSSLIDNESNEFESILLIFDEIIIDTEQGIADFDKLINSLALLQQHYPSCKIN